MAYTVRRSGITVSSLPPFAESTKFLLFLRRKQEKVLPRKQL